MPASNGQSCNCDYGDTDFCEECNEYVADCQCFIEIGTQDLNWSGPTGETMNRSDDECIHEGVECENYDGIDPGDPDFCPCHCVECDV